MGFEAIRLIPESLPNGDWKAFRWEGENRYRTLGETSLRAVTVMELVNGPYAIRFDLPSGRVYFVGLDDNLYRKLTGEGKTVRWLHELFQGFQDKLNRQGLPEAASIYRWSLGRVSATDVALEIFPGSKVEVR